MIRLLKLSLVAWILVAACRPEDLRAQSATPAQPAAPPAQTTPTTEPAPDPTLVTLEILIDATAKIKEEIESTGKLLKYQPKELQQQTIADLEVLKRKLAKTEADFSRISTGVDLDALESEKDEAFDWKNEVQDLLGPIIRELKNMTARPRQIEKLRGEVAYTEHLIRVYGKAILNIRDLEGKSPRGDLKKKLLALAAEWESKQKQAENQLTVVRYQLEEKSREKQSLIESTQNIVRSFFKSRGRNMVLAALAFILSFFLLRYGHRLIYRYSPIHQSGRRGFLIRLGDVLYAIFSVVGATGALMVTLYASGDWVLLGVAIIFLLGVIWTAKQGLPKFWEQTKLLLNFGSVRENERLIYEGIPWRVASINFYCHLENPELNVGRIRIPLKALTDLSSRPVFEEEPWFPTRINDWILLSDGTFGKVVLQTPELVELILLGGDRKFYPTQTYLGLCPQNLSTGFRLNSVFGVDYAHQAIVTREIPQRLQAMLVAQLSAEGYADDIHKIQVQFKAAGSSSLDLEILADFSGKAAHHYQKLKRTLQRIAVDACNTYQWVIPFPQVTVHQADREENPRTQTGSAQAAARS